jgi:hypothetical protein
MTRLDRIAQLEAELADARQQVQRLIGERDEQHGMLRERDEAIMIARAECDALRAQLEHNEITATDRIETSEAFLTDKLQQVTKERDELLNERLLDVVILSDVAAAIGRSGIHCAITFEDAIDRVRTQRDAYRAVAVASLALRVAESTDVPGESTAELESNVPAAQIRTGQALLRWRAAVDTARAAGLLTDRDLDEGGK